MKTHNLHKIFSPKPTCSIEYAYMHESTATVNSHHHMAPAHLHTPHGTYSYNPVQDFELTIIIATIKYTHHEPPE